MHYAINRPIGALRGESDLATVLIWLRHPSGWLEDRVRLNAGVRAFLWVVKAPKQLLDDIRERYKKPPTPGTVIVADSAGEEWSTVTPNLHAGDASRDGRAIRWMIAAGGSGTTLTDFGEGEDANLATTKAMSEQERRFLRRRQRYIVHMLSDLIIRAYARQGGLGARRGKKRIGIDDIAQRLQVSNSTRLQLLIQTGMATSHVKHDQPRQYRARLVQAALRSPGPDRAGNVDPLHSGDH